MSFLIIFFISITLIAFVFIALGIKIIFKKNGKFAGTCASQNPYLNQEGETCSFCGKTADEKCKKDS